MSTVPPTRWLRRAGIGLALVLAIALVLPYLLPIQAGTAATELADPDGRFVTVNGLRTYVIDAGPEDGLPVLLVHGLGGSTFSWRENIAALADAGYRTIALDLPGFGLTDKPLAYDYSHPSQADFIAALLDAVGIEQAVLVGHSMGGSIIGHVAVRHPERVSGLVFVDGAVNTEASRPTALSGAVALPPISRWVQVLAPLLVSRERFVGLLASAYGPAYTLTPEVEAGYARVLQTQDWPNGLVGLIRDAQENALSLADLAAVDVPTLIVWGESDTWVPLSRGEALLGRLAGAQWRSYPLVGHLPMEELPADFNRDLIAFLDTIRETSE
ncbi:MAG: alpha/beta hydrolase [Anaerolineae bacterium]